MGGTSDLGFGVFANQDGYKVQDSIFKLGGVYLELQSSKA